MDKHSEYSNEAASGSANANQNFDDASRPFARELAPRPPDPFERELPAGAVARGAVSFSDEVLTDEAVAETSVSDFAQMPELAPLADGGPLNEESEILPSSEYSNRWMDDGYSEESTDEMAVQRYSGGESYSGGEPPDDVPPVSNDDFSEDDYLKTEAPGDRELDIWEHLGELRTRLLRCVIAIMLGMVLTWQFREQLLGFFSHPIRETLTKYGTGNLQFTQAIDGLMVYLQITFVAAVVLTVPFLLWQVWGFIEPALMPDERRYISLLVPFSTILFFSGCVLGFYMTPLFFKFFLDFTPPGAETNWIYRDTVTLLAKMLLVFGVSFQVPIATIFLIKTGLVSRNFLIEYWRYIVLGIFVIVAVITPTWDPVSLMAAALPPCLLYALSLWIVKWL